MLDYHVHLWPHALRAEPEELRLERLSQYCEVARRNGVEEIALTEHLFRFRQIRDLVGAFWESSPDPALAARMAAYFAHHATEDLDEYVAAVEAAKASGLPVVLGLEVDYYRDQMAQVGDFLAGYPFDVLLGSVHWLGAWMFDILEDEVAMARWDERGTEEAWGEYTLAMEELAASGAADVLAHPDLVKVTGRRPGDAYRLECEVRIAEAAASGGLAAEISSAGLRKPAAELYPSLSLLRELGRRAVPITTASDTHGTGNLAEHPDLLAAHASAASYTHLRAFRARVGYDVALHGTPVRP